MDVDFDYEIQSGAEIAQDISYQLADRERSKAGGVEAGTRIRKRLEELDATVKRLEGALVDMEVGRGGASSGGAVVNARALAQRREAVKKLAIEARRLREREHASPFSSDRDALLSAGTGKSYGRESELTRDLTTQEMVARSNLEIKAQDVVLEKMSRSLDTLKTMGGAIRDETALQMRLLDDTGEEIDKSNTGLVRETARVEHVTKQSSTCWLYTVICFLILTLIILIVVRYH